MKIRIFTGVLLFCASLVSAEILIPDPTIFVDNGKYYLTGTHGGISSSVGEEQKVFPLLISKNCVDWQKYDSNGKLMGIFKKNDIAESPHFWAPQIFKYKGKYYYAYTSNTRKDGKHIGLRVFIASSDKIEDGFKNSFVVESPTPEIDPFVFIDDDETPYICLVHWADGGGIWVQQLSSDLKNRVGKLVSISRRTEDGEFAPLSQEFVSLNEAKKKRDKGISPWQLYNHSRGTIEGPTIVKRHGKYVLFYSTNDFRSPDYRVGVAVADSIFGPYKKLQNAPVIARENTGLNGSGHGDVFLDKNGDMWYVFHAHHSNIQISPRRAAVVKLVETIGDDGYPRYDIDYKTMRLL